MNEKELVVFFTGQALSGIAHNVQKMNVDEIVGKAVEIGVATVGELRNKGLLFESSPDVMTALDTLKPDDIQSRETLDDEKVAEAVAQDS